MITYVVKNGDTLSGLAYKYQTTVAIIMADNPIIKNKNVIQVGWSLKIRTSTEYAQSQSKTASSTQSTANKTTQQTSSQSVGGYIPGATWDGQPVRVGQTGKVTALNTTSLWKLDSKGNISWLRAFEKNASFRVYDRSDLHGGLYNVGGNVWVKVNDPRVSFVAVPQSVLNGGDVTTNAPSLTETYSPTLPEFESANYRRPVLQVKKDDGKIVTMELRVLAVTGGYSSNIQQTKTNGGWFINLLGDNLPVLNVSGVFLDSKSNREFDDFLDRYKTYMQAYKSSKYYSMALCTFYYKNREHKGLIAAFNYTDRQEETFRKNFTLQFVVLNEKSLTGSAINSIPTVINRNGQTEEEYLSNIGSMLTNPITGQQAGHD